MGMELSGHGHYWAFVVHPNLTWDVNMYSAIRKPNLVDRLVSVDSEFEALKMAEGYVMRNLEERQHYYRTGKYISRMILLLKAE